MCDLFTMNRSVFVVQIGRRVFRVQPCVLGEPKMDVVIKAEFYRVSRSNLHVTFSCDLVAVLASIPAPHANNIG